MTIRISADELLARGITPEQFSRRLNFSRQQAIAADICLARGQRFEAMQLIQKNPNFSTFIVEIPDRN